VAVSSLLFHYTLEFVLQLKKITENVSQRRNYLGVLAYVGEWLEGGFLRGSYMHGHNLKVCFVRMCNVCYVVFLESI
jgi:hypothetical protein